MSKKMLSLFLSFVLIALQVSPVLAESIKIPAGTPITIYVNEEIDADDV